MGYEYHLQYDATPPRKPARMAAQGGRTVRGMHTVYVMCNKKKLYM